VECHRRALPTPSVDDGPGFHSNMPVSMLAERDTRAIKASAVSSAPLVAETKDGVMHKTWPTPTKHHGAWGLSHPILDQETEVQRLVHEEPKAASRQTKARGKT
jgi:hypothetical protein